MGFLDGTSRRQIGATPCQLPRGWGADELMRGMRGHLSECSRICICTPIKIIDPMVSLQITTALLGLGLAGLILLLLSRDHLHPLYGLFWMMAAISAGMLGFWPGSINYLARLVGITYPPSLLLLIAVMVLLVKSLHADIVNTRIERQVRRLNQQLAIFELKREGDGTS